RILFGQSWPFPDGFPSAARSGEANLSRILADTAATILETPCCRSVHLTACAWDPVCDVDRISSLDYRHDSQHPANCLSCGCDELCCRLGSRLELLQCPRPRLLRD